MYKRILVAIDGSEPSQLGLDEATALARSLGSSLLLVHVVNKTPWVSPGVDQSVLQHLIDDLRGTGESILHRAMTATRSAGIDADSRLIEALGAEAGECIVSEAASWQAELIVCGTHGRRGLRRLLMGSDAEYIVRHSPVPVLLVRASSSPTARD
jgi:nucleotide-binding universal stress UspA family protein